MQASVNYQERIIAFIDILGFESIVKSLPTKPNLFHNLNYALNRIKYIETSNNQSNTSASKLEVSVFSDSIAISTNAQNFYSLIWTVGWLQAHLMYVGIFVRGGIAIGPTIHENGILYGEGMISAYKLESKSAIYPRIILSNKLRQNIVPGISNYIALDFDHFYYVNPFMFEAVAGNADDLAANGYNPRGDYFMVVGGHIAHNLVISQEEDHLAKYRWIGEKFNQALQQFNQANSSSIATLSLHNN